MATPYDTFPATWAGVPPAMPAGDLIVWRRFHEFAARVWESIAYDVELRDGPYPLVDPDPTMQAMWMKITARRIDALAWSRNVASIIEVRHAAAWQSYGQLMGYATLWEQNYPAIPVIGLWLVTDSIPDDIRKVANDSGIYVWTPDHLTRPIRPRVMLPAGTIIESAPYQF